MGEGNGVETIRTSHQQFIQHCAGLQPHTALSDTSTVEFISMRGSDRHLTYPPHLLSRLSLSSRREI